MSNPLFLVTAAAAEKPREELMVVQTVSTDRRSFVVAKGVKDGVMKGQEIIYANENVSILCKALEVNRNYSLWVPVDRNVNIPFNKEEFVSYNSHAYGNVALDIVGDVNNLTPEIDYSVEFKKFRTSNNFSLKASFDQGLSQSSSDVSADKNSKRSGYSFALEYNFRFLPEFEMSAGGRIDNEVYHISSASLDIPTSRVMGTIAATYHFIGFSKDKNNFYLTLAAGLGKSTTTVSGDKSSGTVTLLPEARVGYLMPFSKSVAMIFEGSVESLSASETFQDGTSQVTNLLNAKFTIGLRF
ncbi:MAG: hypothetical protein PHY93_07530 [Bacteriovorax sp.]|nr:hypothetical protein [Bacteriovorax sp.]